MKPEFDNQFTPCQAVNLPNSENPYNNDPCTFCAYEHLYWGNNVHCKNCKERGKSNVKELL